MRNFGQKMRLMIGRFVVNRINDAGGLQIMQVDGLEGETRDGVERIAAKIARLRREQGLAT